MYCGECKKECEGDWIDVGIGSYEYWGAKGNDVRWVYVSKCCEGDVFKDKKCTIPYEGPDEPDEWEDDYPEDDYREDDRDWITKEEQNALENLGIDTDDMDVRDV